jgi:hypothetical protein
MLAPATPIDEDRPDHEREPTEGDVPRWAIDAEVLDRITHQLRRALEAAGGVEDADKLRDIAAALALLDQLSIGNQETRGRVHEAREELLNKVSSIMLGYQGAEPADPAQMVALAEALALVDGSLG